MEVAILGKVVRVNCPEGQEDALNSAADDLNQRLNQMTERTKVQNKVHNVEQLLAIAALNACYELQTLNQAKDAQAVALEKKVQQLSQVLESALESKSESTTD
ncbi:MAG: cell division protein ZapA [Vibrio sp.]